MIGKEVLLGNGYADLVAVEPSGRLVVVEMRLFRNAEARRAVVAQILTYAAHLKGLSPETVERDVLGRHLRDRDYESIQDAISSNDQEGSFDPATLSEGLTECLTKGHFRLELVLDEAPQELVTLLGYLESVTEELLIDLIAVSAYDVGGSRVLVPQRVDAERPAPEPTPPKTPPSGPGGWYAEGAEDFAATIDSANEEHRPLLRRLYEWAVSLTCEGLVRLGTYHAKGGDMMTLLPRLRADNAGLVTMYNDRGTPSLQFWRSVFEVAPSRTFWSVRKDSARGLPAERWVALPPVTRPAQLQRNRVEAARLGKHSAPLPEAYRPKSLHRQEPGPTPSNAVSSEE